MISEWALEIGLDSELSTFYIVYYCIPLILFISIELHVWFFT